MPPWNHIHPAIVHFPIALLTVAPLLVLVGLLWPAQRRGIHASALILLVLGIGGLILALITGEAVERYARATPALLAGVRDHELAAQWTTLIFGCWAWPSPCSGPFRCCGSGPCPATWNRACWCSGCC
jgi:uncharacterized membrane protein